MYKIHVPKYTVPINLNEQRANLEQLTEKVVEFQKFYYQSLYPSTFEVIKRFQEISNELVIPKSFYAAISEQIQRIQSIVSQYNFTPIYKTIESYQTLVNTINKSFLEVAGVTSKRLVESLQDSISSVSTANMLDALTDVVRDGKFEEVFEDVTIGDLENVNNLKEEDLHILKGGNNDIASSITVRKTMMSDLTVDEYKEIIYDALQKSESSSNNKSNMIGTFFKEVFKNFTINQSISVCMIFIQIIIAIIYGIAQGNHDNEVKNQVQSIINDTSYGKAYKKIFVNNKKVEKPIGKLGYSRVQLLIRSGPKRTSPVVEKQIVPKNTVVILLERKGNWLKVQVEHDISCYIGWVEESKITKFKIAD